MGMPWVDLLGALGVGMGWPDEWARLGLTPVQSTPCQPRSRGCTHEAGSVQAGCSLVDA